MKVKAEGDTVSDGTADPDAGDRARRPSRRWSPRWPLHPPRKPTAPQTGDIHAEFLVLLGSGPGRVHGGIPRGRSGAQDVVLDGERPDPGRGLPQCGLHPLQGAPARRQGDHRGRGDGRSRRLFLGKPKIDLDKLRGWKDSVVGKLTGGLSGLAKGAQGEGRARVRAGSSGPEPDRRGHGAEGDADGELRSMRHRGGLRACARCPSSRMTTLG